MPNKEDILLYVSVFLYSEYLGHCTQNKIKNLLGPIDWASNPRFSNQNNVKREISWPMSSIYPLANEKLISISKREADIRWPLRSLYQLAKEKLTSVGQ